MLRTDYTSQDLAFVDFETVSLCDLRKEGGRRYAEHPTTRVLCLGIVRGDKQIMFVPDWVPLPIPERVHGFRVVREMPDLGTSILVAHNGFEFDAWIWQRFVGKEHAWRDTIPLCRAANLPAGLDDVCQRLYSHGKNVKGKVIEVLSRAKVVAGRVHYPIGTVSAWEAMLEYCADDVLFLRRLHDDLPPSQEPEVLQAHQQCNDRGFPVDRDLCATLVLLQCQLRDRCKATVADVTEGDLYVNDNGSAQRVKAWLLALGVTLPIRNGKPSLDRRDLRALLEDPESFCGGDEACGELVAAVLRLRADANRNTAAKALRMVESADSDSRVCGGHVYHGAHTGRWTGRAVQPHNFPRGLDGVDPSLARASLTLAEAEAEAARLGTNPADVLATLLRPCIAGGRALSIADYGQVEARGVCWLFSEERALSFFRDPTRDYYTHMIAPQIYGIDAEITSKRRFFAKMTGLGAGYGMSGSKLRAMLVADMQDVDAMEVPPEGIIKAYRSAHPNVVAGWKLLEAAAKRAIMGSAETTCRIGFAMQGDDLAATLPSGRVLTYRDAAVEMRVPRYALMHGWSAEPRPAMVYTHPRGWRTEVWGGILTENFVQAMCRDLLADALVRVGCLSPVLHVHDEIVCETEETHELVRLMSVTPAWAEGFPLLVEGFASPRYLKKAPKHVKSIRYMNGVEV